MDVRSDGHDRLLYLARYDSDSNVRHNPVTARRLPRSANVAQFESVRASIHAARRAPARLDWARQLYTVVRLRPIVTAAYMRCGPDRSPVVTQFRPIAAARQPVAAG